jgi:hypothetical protein
MESMNPVDPLEWLAGLDLRTPSADPDTLDVNAHVHIPPNFSSLPDAETAARRASDEGVRVLGLSNYYGTDIYPAFAAACRSRRVFPLFGLEVIVFDESLARSGTRVNDPQNPGKIYICGKGLGRVAPTAGARALFAEISRLDNERAGRIFDRINAHAASRGIPLGLDGGRAAADIAPPRGVPAGSVVLQERFLAEAVATALDAGPAEGRRGRWLAVLGDGAAAEMEKAWAAPPEARDKPVQDLVRKHLMKVGRPAHVEERYVTLEKAFRLFAEMDGIPVYPVLADGASPVCEFEETPESLADRLDAWGVHAVEFIPTRNAPEVLSRYVDTLEARGFFMTAGTEHNSPGHEPIAVRCKGKAPLPAKAHRLFSRGACILAAHQHRRATGQPGFADGGRPDRRELDAMADLGARVIGAATTGVP